MKNKRTGRRVVQKAAQAAMIAAALFLFGQAGIAAAGDRDHGGDSRHESKIYGTVERLPKDLIGLWVVNGREIVVDNSTRIKEKHGRVEVGAYVKIEGFNKEKSFVADEIEVKRARSER